MLSSNTLQGFNLFSNAPGSCMNVPMRRSERLVTDKSKMKDIIDRSQIGVLALTDGDQPYGVPLHFGYKWEEDKPVFYFHGAKTGRKVNIIAKNPKASFSCVASQTIVPSKPGNPCAAGAKYESVIVDGTCSIVESDEEKVEGLVNFMKHYNERTGPFSAANLTRTAIIKLVADRITGKKNPNN